MNKISDKLLLHRIVSRKDKQAFGELYDRYVERIYRFIFFKISHKEDSEDLTSEVFVKTWKYLINPEHTKVKSFSGLIYTIARNSVIDWYRYKSSRQECTLENVGSVLVDPAVIEGLAAKNELAEVLLAIKGMKQDYQEVILLRHVEGLSISEISQIVGKKQTTVRVTLHRALKKLRYKFPELNNGSYEQETT